MARRPTIRTLTSDPGLTLGYRSGLEDKIAAEFAARGVDVAYEATRFFFTPPLKQRSYTPDWILPNGVVVETKGRFVSADRQRHKVLKEEHPDLDIRFVFSNSRTKISKGSKTTYGMWCEQYGFLYANKSVPIEWIGEPPCPVRLAAIVRASSKKP